MHFFQSLWWMNTVYLLLSSCTDSKVCNYTASFSLSDKQFIKMHNQKEDLVNRDESASKK